MFPILFEIVFTRLQHFLIAAFVKEIIFLSITRQPRHITSFITNDTAQLGVSGMRFVATLRLNKGSVSCLHYLISRIKWLNLAS